MMKRAALILLSLLVCASPAQALKLIVWDGELQTKLGAGESSGSKMSVQLVRDYSGPVKVIFSQSADEKARGLFSGLLNSYDGVLKNGLLTLLIPDEDGKSGADKARAGYTPGPSGTPGTAPASLTPGNPPSSALPLNRFLQQFRLSLAVQTTGQLPSMSNLQSYK